VTIRTPRAPTNPWRKYGRDLDPRRSPRGKLDPVIGPMRNPAPTIQILSRRHQEQPVIGNRVWAKPRREGWPNAIVNR